MFPSRMSRAGAVAGALVLLAGPLAGLAGASAQSHTSVRASSVSGAVVATNTSRDTLVLASHAHLVTLRVSAATAARTRLGTLVRARVTHLADGTDHVLSMSTGRHTNRAHFRAVVVSSSPTSMSVSGGGSVVTLTRAAHARHAHDSSGSSSNPGTGTIVNVNAGLGAQGLDEITVIPSGSTALITLQGTLGTPASGSLTVTTESGETITVIVPSSIMLPSTLSTGQQVELLVDYNPSTSSFSLVTISTDGTGGAQGVSQPSEDAVFDVEGLVTAMTPASGTALGTISVQPGEGGSVVTMSVPSTVNVPPAVQLNTYVHAEATIVSLNGVATTTLVSIHPAEGDGGQSGVVEIEGTVSSNNGTTLVIQTNQGDNSQASSQSVIIPPSMQSEAAPAQPGSRVHVRAMESVCTSTSSPGTICLTLVDIKIQQPEGDGGGSTSTGATPSTLQLSGTVVTFQAATSTSTGSLVVQPSTGATVIFVVPSSLLSLALSTSEQVNVTASQTSAGNVLSTAPTVQLSGTVSAFTSATGTSNGSMTLLLSGGSQSATIVIPSAMASLSLAVSPNVTVGVLVNQTTSGYTLVQVL